MGVRASTGQHERNTFDVFKPPTARPECVEG